MNDGIKLLKKTGIRFSGIRDMRDLPEDEHLHKQEWETDKGVVRTGSGFQDVRAHVYLTIGLFNMTLAYRSDEGEEIAAE